MFSARERVNYRSVVEVNTLTRPTMSPEVKYHEYSGRFEITITRRNISHGTRFLAVVFPRLPYG